MQPKMKTRKYLNFRQLHPFEIPKISFFWLIKHLGVNTFPEQDHVSLLCLCEGKTLKSLQILKGFWRAKRKRGREKKEEIIFYLKIFEGFITHYYQFQKKLREGYELWKFYNIQKKMNENLQGFYDIVGISLLKFWTLLQIGKFEFFSTLDILQTAFPTLSIENCLNNL